ncbi:MAG TPA: AAA family ATPase [Anaerolineae bacterium]|nr:AAA family ATPase [Anaerolineae bacterium]
MIRLKRLYAHDFKQLQEVEIKFPEAGRILVQGKNEAGKSTLFEAVFFALFAQALSTEGAAKNLDDLIGYEKEKARVELDLTVRDRVFKITRTLIRGKSNKWELDIERPDGTVEQVRGNKPVNDRLVQELGFDAEALLNTCFVEQKKLEKLEGMSKTKREESLAKLLNLERLLELEDALKLRGEDEKLLTRLAHRVELAKAQAELPGVTEELQAAEKRLKLLEAAAYARRAFEEMTALEAFATQLQELGTKRAQLQDSVARVDALDKARQMMDVTLGRYDALAEANAELQRLQAENDRIQRGIQEHVPALQKRLREVHSLGLQAARLTRVEAVRANATLELQRAQNIRQELDGHFERGKTLNESIATYEARLNALEEKLHAYDVGDALGEWAAAMQASTVEQDSTAQLDAKRAERDALNRAQRQALITLAGIVVAIGVLSALLLPALAISTGSLILTVIVALVIAALATTAVVVLAGRLINTNREASRVTEDLGKLEGEASARRILTSAAQGRINGAIEKLEALHVPIPASVSVAQAKRVELAATLENKTRAELFAEREEVREKLNYARAQRDEVTKRINEVSPSTDGANIPELERTRDKAEQILNQWRPRIARRAAQYELPPETEALRDAYRTIQADLKAWDQRIQEAATLRENAERIGQRIAKAQSELKEQYSQVAALLNGTTPAWSPTLERNAYVTIQTQLGEAFQAAGGDQVRATMAQVEKEFGGLEREQSIRTKNVRDAVSAARTIERELGIQDGLPPQPTKEQLWSAVERIDQASLGNRAELETRVKELNQRVGELRGTRERFERELGLVGEKVDIEQAQTELQNEKYAQAQRRYGAEIVARARRRIIQKILPATMEYMRRILPQLTRDRYHDAELDPETYKIKVWDERAGQSGAWKEKNIFSGGTKDQFSLALRLAFALATLPQERGTSPGFIFLDEPLGSFDADRASALLYLLTEGEIGRAFEQIFLISHVPVQESKFTHRIRLESGKVIDTNLNEE